MEREFYFEDLKVDEEIKQQTQKKINNAADIVKNMDQKAFGGESALFFYDKFNNFVFCFRTKDKTKQEILNSFCKYMSMIDGKVQEELNRVLKESVKMEFITCAQY